MIQIDNIDKRVFTFFIENLSYCALNKQKGISLYSNLEETNLLLEIKDWFEIIFRRKYFHKNPDQPKLIYFFIPDKATVKRLNKIFRDFKYEDFAPYFDFCYNRIIETYDENKLELFSCINFFHLIGSLRYFKSKTQSISKLISTLYNIIDCEKLHPLIKYSALQITTLFDVRPENDPNAYRHRVSFENEYFKQLELLKQESNFAKYISFYSMYYHNNEFNPNQLVKEKYLTKIISNGKIDFHYLHTLIPQIASLLIRLDTKKYEKENFHSEFEKMFQIREESEIDKIQHLQEKIKDVYK